MKSILIPVDFSNCSFKAAQYAAELAKLSNAKLIFFNAYFFPVSAHETYIGPDVLVENENRVMKQLIQFSGKVLSSVQDSAKLEFHNEVAVGLLMNNLRELIKEYDVSLVVMGTKGQSGSVKKFLLGSNAASVLYNSPVPVLVIPEKALFKPIKKIVFATSLEEIKDLNILSPLVEISWLQSFEIHFLVIIKDESVKHTGEQLREYMQLDSLFKHIPHYLEVVEDQDIVFGIDKYIDEIQADMLVTIPGKHDLIGRLFNKSITREMVFHSEIPVFCLK